MTTPSKTAAIRLGTEGKTTVTNDFNEVEKRGAEAFQGVAKAADAATSAINQTTASANQAAAAAGRIRPSSVPQAVAPASTGRYGVNPQTGETFESRKAAANYRADAAAAERLREAIDPLYAAQARYNREVEAANRLVTEGHLKANERVAYLAKEKKALDEAAAAAKANATGQFHVSEAQKRYAKINLARQGADVFTQGFSGTDAGLIAIQQGPQILDAAAMAGVRLTGSLGLVAAAFAAVATPVIALGGHIASTHKQLLTIDATLTRLSDGSHYRVAALGEDARALRAMGASSKDSTAEIQAFLANGVDPSRIVQFGRAAQATADILRVGLGEAAQNVGKAFTGNFDAIKSLDDSLNFLTASERDQIKAMFESGDAASARSTALEIYTQKMEAAAAKANGPWTEAMRNLKSGWDSFLDSLANTKPVEVAGESVGNVIKGWTYLLNLAKSDAAKTDKELFQDLIKANEKLNAAKAVRASNTNHALGRDATLDLNIYDAEQRVKKAQDLYAKTTARTADTILQGTNAQGKRLTDLIDAATPKDSQIAKLKSARQEIQDGLDHNIIEPQGLAAAKAAIAAYDKQITELQKPKGQGRAQSLVREAEAVRVNTAATLDLARAYLESGDAALRAEVRRKAMTAATRRGTDAATAERDQLANAIAQEAANGAKAVASMRAQTAAQNTVNAAVAAGTITSREASGALSLENALRPLTIAQAHAEAEAKSALTATILALRDAYKEAAEAQGLANLQSQNSAGDDTLERLKLELDLIGKTNEQREIALALFQARQDIFKSGASVDPDAPLGADGKPDTGFAAAVDRVVNAEAVARKEMAVDRGRYAADTIRSQEEQLTLTERELALMGETEAKRNAVLNLLRLEQDLKRQGVDLASAEGQQILRNAQAQSEMNVVLDRARAVETERRQMQDRMFGDLEEYLNAGKYNWKSFGDLARKELTNITAELVRMAAINPLRNWLLGENNPTIRDMGGGSGGLGGLFSAVFGTGNSLPKGAAANPWSMSLTSVLGFAGGTDNAPGGWAWVGEQGPELRKLRPGDVIKSAPASARMAKGQIGDDMRRAFNKTNVNVVTNHNYDLSHSVTTADLMKQLQEQIRNGDRASIQAAVEAAIKAVRGGIGDISRSHFQDKG